MSTLLLSQLHDLHHRLQQVSINSTCSTAEQQELHEILIATTQSLDMLYKGRVARPHQFQLLQNLTMLRELNFLAPNTDHALSLWQTLHRFLQTAIQTTLSDEADAGLAAGGA